MARAYLSCGSNLGDRAGYLRQAVAGLEQAAGVRVLRRSSLYETEAWGPVEQPDYLNGALLIETELPPHSLLDLCQELELTDVTLVHARAEEFGGKKSPQRETFDYVTARAVARLSVLSELCLPLVRVGGQLIALKAQKAAAELAAAQRAISLLGGRVAATKRFALPQSGDERNVIVIDKEYATPRQYPRKAGTPAKKPLTNK